MKLVIIATFDEMPPVELGEVDTLEQGWALAVGYHAGLRPYESDIPTDYRAIHKGGEDGFVGIVTPMYSDVFWNLMHRSLGREETGCPVGDDEGPGIFDKEGI